jgi:hypothetical protein
LPPFGNAAAREKIHRPVTSRELTRPAGFGNFRVSCHEQRASPTCACVLNRLWQAVNVCTARRALTLLFQGQAQVVLNEDDGSFRTFSFSGVARPSPNPRRTRNPSTPSPSASACRASSCC